MKIPVPEASDSSSLNSPQPLGDQLPDDLTRRGVVVLGGRTLDSDPSSFGIVIFRAGSQAAAEGIMRGDPAVSAGIFRAELFPHSVALMEGKP